jgi:hypothetical protein
MLKDMNSLGRLCCSLEKGIVAGRATYRYISDTLKLHNTEDFSTSNLLGWWNR